MSNVSQHVKPLNVSKSMSSCKVRNRNVHIVSVSHYTKPLSVGKSDCSRKGPSINDVFTNGRGGERGGGLSKF